MAPYQTNDYNPPALPELKTVRTFEEVRDGVSRIMQYLQHLQASSVDYFQQLRHNLNSSASGESPVDITAAPTIEPLHFMNVIVGSATITNILRPRHFSGQLMLISQDGFTLSEGGNISLLSSPDFINPGNHVMLTFIPSRNVWVGDSCRLAGNRSSLSYGGRAILTDASEVTPFRDGFFAKIGKFVLTTLSSTAVEVDLPEQVAEGPSWGGFVFNSKGITFYHPYSYLSLQADGGSKKVQLMMSGSEVPTRPVQDAQLTPNAQWQGTIWYRSS